MAIKLETEDVEVSSGSNHEKALRLIGNSEEEMAEFFKFLIEKWLEENEEKTSQKSITSALYSVSRSYYNGVDLLTGYKSS